MTGSGLALQFGELLPYVAVLLAFLTILLGVLSVRQALQLKADAEAAGSGTTSRTPPSGEPLDITLPRPLSQSFKHASLQLRRLVAGGGGIYEVPWIITVGAGGTELDRLLPEPLELPPELAEHHLDLVERSCTLSFRQGGVVLGFSEAVPNSTHWRKRLLDLLHATRQCRPDRPVDSLVLTLPVADLRRPADQLARLGEQFYQLIWTVQRVTGWRVPIYLLVRGCEDLTGFLQWAAALPQAAGQQTLGWAVPYAVDSVFQPSWVSDGIAQLCQRLSTAQFPLMMSEPQAGVAEELFLFPGEVDRLASPLALVLSSILRASAYHEAFMFRGFFLCGAMPDAVANPPNTADAFAPAVFSRVFAEHRLAQPAYGEKTRRQRQIRIAQVCLGSLLVLCGIGFVSLRQTDSAELPRVQQLLDKIQSLISSRQVNPPPEANQQAGTARRRAEQDGVIGLLQAMADIQINHIDTIAAPASLLSPADDLVEQAIAAGYDADVLQSSYHALTDEQSLQLLLAPPLADAAPRQALVGTADRIGTYNSYVGLYRTISTHLGIDQLAKLLQYALGVDLPPGFTTNYRLYEQALGRAHLPPIPISSVRSIVQRILQARFDAATRAAYGDSDLARAVARLAALGGSGAPSLPANGPDEANSVADIAGALATIAGQVTLPQYAWLATNTDDNAPWRDVATLNGAPVLPPDFVTALQQQSQKAQQDARAAMLGAQAFDSPVLVTSATQADLTPSMKAVRSLLDNLLAQAFMRPIAGGTTVAPPAASASSVTWNAAPLRQAEDLAEAYTAFIPQATDGGIPPLLAREIQASATAQLTNHIQQLLALAARPAITPPQDAARAALLETSNLSQVLPLLTNLRNTLRQAGAGAAADAIDQLVSGQAVRLLRQIDNSLIAAAPYQLADPRLSAWSGQTPLAEAAFRAASPVDLASTMPARRDFVETLARDYAAPLVSYLRDPGTTPNAAAAGLVQRWQAILNVFDQYHRSDPNNSLTRLEQFITVDMDKNTLANCSQLPFGSEQDYFAEQLQIIQRAVASRCRGLAATDAANQYASLAADFNAHLAGRFPFTASQGPAAALGAADPADVRRFLLQYADVLQPLETQFATGARCAAATAFLGQLAALEQAFAPMLADPAGNTPLWYQLNVTFFTNPAQARSQNEVLDATVDAGGQGASSMAGTSQLSWTNGQPIHVGLRWAANAPSVPDPAAHGLGWPRIDGLTANFSAEGPWSLLRLIRSQSPAPVDANALDDRQPEVLAFDVPLMRNPAAATGDAGDSKTARVYLRLVLTAVIRTPGQPDKTVPVQLPDFPAAAPGLTQRAAFPAARRPPVSLPKNLLSSKASP